MNEVVSMAIKFLSSGSRDLPLNSASTSDLFSQFLILLLAVAFLFAGFSLIFKRAKNKSQINNASFYHNKFNYQGKTKVIGCNVKSFKVIKIAVILLSLSLCLFIWGGFTISKALANQETNSGNFSISEVVGTVNYDDHSISFNDAELTNNSSTDYVFDTCAVIKKSDVKDDDCTWTIKSGNSVLYNDKASTTETPFSISEDLFVPAHSSVSVSVSQTGLSFESAEALVDTEPLSLSLGLTVKASEEDKQNAIDELSDAIANAKEEIMQLPFLSDEQKIYYTGLLDEIFEEFKSEIKDFSKLKDIQEASETYKDKVNVVVDNAKKLNDEKHEASKKISEEYNDAVEYIESLSDLSDEQKAEFLQELEDAKNNAEEALVESKTSEDIENLLKQFSQDTTKIRDNAWKVVIDLAKKFAEDKAAWANGIIDQFKYAEKEKYSGQVSAALDQYGEDLLKATTQEEVTKLKEDLSKKIEDIVKDGTEDNKAKAKEVVDKLAEDAAEDIKSYSDYFTEEQIQAYLQTLEDNKDKAKQAIDEATTFSGIDNGITIFKYDISVQIFDIEAIVALKQKANSALNGDGTEAKSKIDELKNLTKDKRITADDSYYKKIEKIIADAKANIVKVNTEAEINAVVSKAEADIANLIKEASDINSKSYWTLIFEMQEHGTQIEPVTDTYQYGSKLNSVDNPSEFGWLFQNWYKDADCSEVWDFTNNAIDSKWTCCNQDTCTVTLYAKWEQGSKVYLSKDVNVESFAYEDGTVISEDKITVKKNAEWTFRVNFKEGFGESAVTEKRDTEYQNIVKADPIKYTFTTPKMLVDNWVNAESTPINSLTVKPSDTAGDIRFYPVFDGYISNKSCCFYNGAGLKIYPSDLDNGYVMSDLFVSDSTQKTTEEKIKSSVCAYNKITAGNFVLRCCQVVDKKWTDVFLSPASSTEEVSAGLTSDFITNYCKKNIETVYFEPNGNISKTADNWDAHDKATTDKDPKINGVKYSEGTNGLGKNAWYGAYGGSDSGLLGKESSNPFATRISKPNFSYSWDTINSVWAGKSQAATSGVVITCDFSDGTLEYDANGSTSSAPASVTKPINSTFALAGQGEMVAPENTYFTGWNTKADYKGTHYSEGDNFEITSGYTKLYAEWKPLSVEITFTKDANVEKITDKDGNDLGAKTTITPGSDLTFKIVFKDGFGEDSVTEKIVNEEQATTMISDPEECTFTTSSLAFNAAITITSKSIKSFIVHPSDAAGDIHFYPAFSGYISQSNCTFYNGAGLKMYPSDTSKGYAMADLSNTKSSLTKAENIANSVAYYSEIGTYKATFKCYQTIDAKWADVFEASESTPGCSTGLKSDFVDKYCKANVNSVYFNTDGTLKADENWDAHATTATDIPSLNGVYYSSTDASKYESTWFGAYGGGDGKLFSTKASTALSSRVSAASTVNDWEATNDKWSTCSDNTEAAVVLSCDFGWGTVTFDANGGSNPPAAQTVSIGSSISMPGNTGMTAPTNKVFKGWNTESDGSGKSYEILDPYTVSKCSTTIYAQWASKHQFTITKDANVDKVLDQYGNELGSTVDVVAGETLTFKVIFKEGYAEDVVSETISGVTNTLESDPQKLTFTTSALNSDASLNITSQSYTAFTATPSAEVGQIRFYPAFDGGLHESVCVFFNVAGLKMKPSDPSTGYVMSDLYVKPTAENSNELAVNLSVGGFKKVNSSAEISLKCYQSVKGYWSSAFNSSTNDTGTSTGLSIDFRNKYCNNGIETPYYYDGYRLRKDGNWNYGFEDTPTLNGVDYSKGNDGSDTSAWYGAYGGYGSGLLDESSVEPWSCSLSGQNAALWSTVGDGKWETRDWNDHNGVLLERSFGDAYVSFDANGGSGSVSSIFKQVGEQITLPSASALTPPRSGVTFVGWNTTSEGIDTTYKAGDKYIIKDTITTFYAQWSYDKHSLTVDTGTSAGKINFYPAFAANTLTKSNVIFYSGNTVIEPSNGTYYKMADLYNSGTNVVDSYEIVDGTTTLKCYQTVDTIWSDVFDSASVGTVSPNLTKKFMNTYCTNGIETVYYESDGKTVKSDGHWDYNYTSANPTLNNVAYSDKNATDDTTWYYSYGASSGGKLSSNSHTPLSSWNSTGGKTYSWDAANKEWKEVSNTDTYSVVLERTFGNGSVSFSVGDGSGTAPDTIKAELGMTVNLPGQGSMVAPTGKEFVGWTADGKTYEPGGAYTLTSSKTLVAKWDSFVTLDITRDSNVAHILDVNGKDLYTGTQVSKGSSLTFKVVFVSGYGENLVSEKIGSGTANTLKADSYSFEFTTSPITADSTLNVTSQSIESLTKIESSVSTVRFYPAFAGYIPTTNYLFFNDAGLKIYPADATNGYTMADLAVINSTKSKPESVSASVCSFAKLNESADNLKCYAAVTANWDTIFKSDEAGSATGLTDYFKSSYCTELTTSVYYEKDGTTAKTIGNWDKATDNNPTLNGVEYYNSSSVSSSWYGAYQGNILFNEGAALPWSSKYDNTASTQAFNFQSGAWSSLAKSTQGVAVITRDFGHGEIKIDANGGTNPPKGKSGKIGDTYIVPDQGDMVGPNPTSIFTGWNTKSDGTGIAYAAGETYTIWNKSETLYAQWVDTKHTVTLSHDDGVDSFTDINGVALGSTVEVSEGLTLQFKIKYKSGYGENTVVETMDGSATTLEPNENTCVFTSSNIMNDATINATSLQIQSLSVNVSSSVGLMRFLPAFKNDIPTSDYIFYNGAGLKMKATGAGGYIMSDLAKTSPSKTAEENINSSIASFVKVNASADNLKCYQVVNATWSDAFLEPYYGSVSEGLTQSFLEKYCVNGIQTVYFMNDGVWPKTSQESPSGEVDNNWNKEYSSTPLLNGVEYSAGGVGEDKSAWYGAYGRDECDLFVGTAGIPWSSRIDSHNAWYYRTNSTINWLSGDKKGTGAIVLKREFGNSTVKFDANGSTSTPPSTVSGKVGDSIKLPDQSGMVSPISGAEFVGWSTAANWAGAYYEPNSTYYLTDQNVTLYAVWKKLYNVTINKDSNVKKVTNISGIELSGTFSWKQGSSLTFSIDFNDGYGENNVKVTSGGTTTTLNSNPNQYTFRISEITNDTTIEITSTKLTSLTVRPSDTAGDIHFYPAFAGNISTSNYVFYNGAGLKMTPSSSSGYIMDDLSIQSLSGTSVDNVKSSVCYFVKVNSSAANLKCYQVVDKIWSEVFMEPEPETYVSKRLNDMFWLNYCQKGIQTVYFEADGVVPKTTENWNCASQSCPQLNGVDYSQGTSGEGTGGWYGAYGGSKFGLMKSYGYMPWSTRISITNKASYWDATKGLWTSSFWKNMGGAVLYREFGSSTLTYNANTGSGAPAAVSGNIGDVITLSDGSTMTPPAGKKFLCWNSKADGTGRSYSSAIMSSFSLASPTMTLYAIWIDA